MERRDTLDSSTGGSVREAVELALDALDSGRLRVAREQAGEWQLHQWLKKAVLLSFRLNDMRVIGRWPGRRAVVGQGRFQFLGWSGGALSRGRIPRGAQCDRAPLPFIAPVWS